MYLQIADNAYPIVMLQGSEGLSQSYEFSLVIEVELSFSISQCLLQPACLIFSDKLAPALRYCQGIITASEYLSLTVKALQKVRLRLQSRLSLMRQQNSCRVIAKSPIFTQIIALLKPYGLTEQQCHWKLFEPDLDPMCWVQPPVESDWSFLQRFLSLQGLCFCMINHEEQEKILFTDNISQYSCQHLFNVYADSHGAMLTAYPVMESITKHHRLSYAEHIVRDYSEHTPDSVLEVLQGNEAYYMQHSFAQNNPQHKQIARQALLAYEQSKIARQWLMAKSHIQAFYPGQAVRLVTEDKEIKGDYLVVKLNHYVAKGVYTNQVKLLPLECHYRPKFNANFIMSGVWLGRGKGNTLYPNLDKFGTYTIELRFTLKSSDSSDIQGVRFLSHNSQWHLPLPNDAEVAIGYINEDPQRPVVLGACHNSHNSDPITSNNSKQSCLKSATMSALVFNNAKDNSSIKVQTGDQNAYIRLCNTSCSAIELAANNGNIQLQAERNILLSGSEYSEYSEKSRIINVGQNYQIKTFIADICLRGSAIQFLGDTKISIHAKSSLQISTSLYSKIEIENTISNMAREMIILTKNNLKIQAKDTVCINSKSTLRLGHQEAGIELSSEGIVKCYGNFMSILANKCYLGEIIPNLGKYKCLPFKVRDAPILKPLQRLSKEQQTLEAYQDELICTLSCGDNYFAKVRDLTPCLLLPKQNPIITKIRDNSLSITMLNICNDILMQSL